MPRRPSIIPKETPEGVRVSIPATLSKDGKRHRKFFHTMSEAEKFAASLRNQRDSSLNNTAINADLAVKAALPTPKRPKDRSPNQTLLGVSLPKDLKERIRKAAARENRTMANWSAYYLRLVVDKIDAEMKSKK